MSRSLKWQEWNPGLDTDDMTLGEVLATLPASPPDAVPEIIRRYENPESPEALPGAVGLVRHDCIHVLLGRGLTTQDEAFVIGFTMGAASDFTAQHQEIFERVSVYEYPGPWAFKEQELAAYRLGVGLAEDVNTNMDIHLIPLESAEYQVKTVREIRAELGLVKGELRAYYTKERLLISSSGASLRLDDCAHRSDGALLQPSGSNT